MCATNLWAVNAAAFTPDLHRFTLAQIGTAPAPTATRIVSSRVRGSSAVFTLTRRMCDCDSLIGRRNDAPVQEEPSADAWLAWLRDLPMHVPHISRIAVLRVWSPESDDVVPARSRGIKIAEISEDVLRGIREGTLLTIDYPRVV